MFKKKYEVSAKPRSEFKLNIKIKKLDKKVRDVIVELLNKNLPDDFDATIDEIRDKASLDKKEASNILYGLVSLYITHYRSGESIDEFLESKKYDGVRDFYKEVLLGDDSIGIISKRIFLEVEDINRLFRSTVITDFRPIFFNDPLVEPRYGMIKHTFSLSVASPKGIKEIFITLDKESLEDLLRVVERARNKEKTLENSCKKNGIKLFHKGFDIING